MPGWLWLLTGMVLGAFIMFLLRLNDLKIEQPPELAATQNKPASADEAQPQKPKFSFYDDLKKEQVEIPDYDPPQEQQSAPTHQFFLQVASFRRKDDADSARASLILLNMNAQIEKSKLSSGSTAYRVIVGPYQNKSRLAKARQTLVSNNFEYLTLKREL
jgi:cell division protein FtsN